LTGWCRRGLGLAAGGGVNLPSVLLLGDLSLYHDMNGLWALRRHGLCGRRWWVCDNDGGRGVQLSCRQG